ncbi:MAG: divalent-cation tolerance protein CutA [Candidatus Diapherotrites archaeon]|nr:divalent-cation tolerance protein CutA [Candidatus Diapherotrites archaeon]
MQKCDDVSVVFVTAPTLTEARLIAKTLIAEKKAACVQIQKVESFFKWEEQLKEIEEYLIIIKAKTSRLDEIEDHVKQYSTYDTPEIISLPVQYGSKDYLDWVRSH